MMYGSVGWTAMDLRIIPQVIMGRFGTNLCQGGNLPEVIAVSLEVINPLHGVVIVHSDLKLDQRNKNQPLFQTRTFKKNRLMIGC